MVMVNSIDDVVSSDLCISCGACCVYPQLNNAEMKEKKEKGMYVPTNSHASHSWGSDEFEICPGKGYEIVKMGEEGFPDSNFSSVNLGRWDTIFVARSLSNKLVESAASGGVMTGLAEFLLDNNVVEGVVTTGMEYSSVGPRPNSRIATTTEELVLCQGSKYCPVPIFNVFSEICAFEGKLLFIGTPCQIAGLKLMQKKMPWLAEKIPLTVGNFCGGFRDFRETQKLINRSGIRQGEVNYFRYRGEGQPGSMVIRDQNGNEAKLPYPDYARMTGVTKNVRCRLCVDATAELADFACGDAWIPRYLKTGKSWSIIIARSKQASNILREMELKKNVELQRSSVEEVELSQRGNLTSKKHRQGARRYLYSLLRIELPQFDGGFQESTRGMALELKVHFSHLFFSLLEKVGLYVYFAKLIRRYPE